MKTIDEYFKEREKEVDSNDRLDHMAKAAIKIELMKEWLKSRK
jgi:hypothetical protein